MFATKEIEVLIKIYKELAKAFLLSLIIFALTFCLSICAEAQTERSVKEIVKTLSGGKLKVETRAKPYKLEADFNGDKIKDAAIVVELLDLPKNIGAKIKKAYPYYSKKASKNDLAMLIIHGAGKGWRTAQKESILLVGENSAMIFEKERFNEEGDSVEIERQKNGRVRLFFSTEGSEGYLKWNGKRYVWWETNP